MRVLAIGVHMTAQGASLMGVLAFTSNDRAVQAGLAMIPGRSK